MTHCVNIYQTIKCKHQFNRQNVINKLTLYQLPTEADRRSRKIKVYGIRRTCVALDELVRNALLENIAAKGGSSKSK